MDNSNTIMNNSKMFANTVDLQHPQSNVPAYSELEAKLAEAGMLVNDIVLKNYLHNLSDLKIIPLADSMKQISDIRFFKITEMVYQKDEYSTYKFASVFSALQNLNCGVFIMLDSNGLKTDFYMGVRSLDNKRTPKSLKDTLKNALCGQFPGVKSNDLLEHQEMEILKNIPTQNIASVSCVANNKDEDFKDNETFIQGLEKLALAMQGKNYTAIVLAKGTSDGQLNEIKNAYESIYTQLSPFANMQLSYGTNTALSISEALSQGFSMGTSYSQNTSVTESTSTTKGYTESTSTTKGYTESKSTSKPGTAGTVLKKVGSTLLGVASLATAPLTGGASLIAAGAISLGNMAINSYTPKTTTTGTSASESYSKCESKSESYSKSESKSNGETYGTNESKNESNTHTQGLTSGTSNNMQLNMQNKAIIDVMERIDAQLKRIDECESLGMWECAAYFLSDTRETAEMAAGTYKALMKGSKSGVETSAVNFWGYRDDATKVLDLREYITNFIHPEFVYETENNQFPVTAASLVSSNELAVQMGLPRKSVCGFPVIEHADFGKEVVSYDSTSSDKAVSLGKVFNMGKETESEVNLNIDSLTMHTFITGSTGSGKSNTVYTMLKELKDYYRIPFLVIEPAKGEYKNVFGNSHDVTVLGTNPEYSRLLQINPFKFPPKIHILEHIDRLVEIFNVCWPMYAAMPAVLKNAVLQSYEVCGWDLVNSKNVYSPELFPTFIDLQNELEKVIENSAYADEVKSNYKGSLLTRVKSLTNGLNGQIFINKETDNEILFDSSVIIDLSRVGSLETKSLIMGILVMRLSEHRSAYSKEMNAPLKHITVLEEAHNILPRISKEQDPESSNIAGKSVEMISNAIAEMRTYGESFIIADQSPNFVDISAIRNTNTKIIMRLPDESDRILAGKSAALKDEQINEIARLPKGVAVIYQNDWVESVLCKVNKFDASNKLYEYQRENKISLDEKKYKSEVFKLLLKGRTIEQAEPDVDLINQELPNAKLTTNNKIKLFYLADEYKRNKNLKIWDDKRFGDLSEIVYQILSSGTNIESLILNSETFDKLTDSLTKEITKQTENLSRELHLSICQCLMKEFSKESHEKLLIYSAWRKEIIDKCAY